MASFADQIAKFKAKTMHDASKAITEIRIGVSDSIINKTPIDTGFARGNWQSSIGSPIKSEITRFDREAGFAPTGGDGISLREAQEVAETEADKDFYLTSNAEYIMNLEFGGSDQAPHGMVRVTVADFQNIVNDIVKGLK